ncbi:hybrid non-ribosomal peptide synthetase/type I polyketide synthase [Bradyrhizobium erythrophlei]|uniref:Amino acid adenylation domain-containing protein n=1 Tax=Bradyrhizobium erythrophlei TaxID=1437360 RepID=A0A1M5PBE8_9BRAD|nr:hybrid non-ribosomal peptide synthetase/type I polyketide synthase [Bradyrhizobium erythrophlei]SHG99118.1 amino acid adenylation domain-containing protein [Bradyrhizobium erythrophlei]
MSDQETQGAALEGVAIIGMAGRFPGARSVAEFWRNQLEGIESISHFRVEDLEISNRAGVANDPRYIRARSVLDDVDLFDADFFGIYPREAELMDPQQRLFLECCWQAIEDAGYVPDTYPGQIGIYAGSSVWSYFLTRLCTAPGFIEKFTSGYQVSNYFEMMGNSLDFLSTRVSYKLNLRGPSFTMVSACSTSLLAVTQACQSLLTYQSDMALAGGVSITFPQKRGYYYQDGGMVSPDGHVRAFDADAQGTVFGSGLGVVLLKRLDEAIRDGDQIYAVIRGFAVNNDGSAKVGYTAPSVEGQASVIAMAQEAAGVEPESIGYIEAHGTGTPLGDPIELAGLTRAFRARTDRTQFCTIGTAKTNVGHLDIAAGVTGLINATHIVRDGMFPPTLHFNQPNPNFDFKSSPFRVISKRTEWKTDGGLRRAGVSAFGVGGTNAHVVLEQAPERHSLPSARPNHLLVLSARSLAALDQATDNLAAHLKSHPDLNLADVAWTLQAGRRSFDCRRAVVAANATEAIASLSKRDREHVQTRSKPNTEPELYFLFPGQGSQHPNMAREIYDTEPVFREAVDRCAQILRPHLDTDLLTLLYPPDGTGDEVKRRVTETVIAQPAIFTIEYGLAQLWMSWGIRPKAMAGHSIGEFVAACLAGVISLEDALTLVALRGRMMQGLPAGGMLSVRLSEAEVRKRLPDTLSLAAVNSPSLCVVAGALEPLGQFEHEMTEAGVACRRLVTSHAFHSGMMDPLIDPLTDALSKVQLSPPQIPYVSGVTGAWITADEATDARYWARHAREAVQFSAAIKELRKNPQAILLEVGPGNVLATLARQHGGFPADQAIVSSLSDGFSGEGDFEALMTALGALWLAGEKPDWTVLNRGGARQRVSLPTYPFQRKRYWLESIAVPAETPVAIPSAGEATTKFAVAESQINQGTESVNIVPNIPSVPQPTSSADRATRVQAALVEMFAELSGIDLSTLDSATTFLELGFDSLFLTQAAQALQEKFGIKVTFRQLLNDVASLDALTEYVESLLPPEIFAAPATAEAQLAPVQPALPAAGPVASAVAQLTSVPAGTASESLVERLMREQLQAMNQLFAKQLETLQGTPSRPATSPPSSAAISAPVTKAPAKVAASAVDAGAAAAASKPLGDEIKPFGPYKPPQTAASKELTKKQEKHLNVLIDRVTRRTAKSKSFTQEYRKVLADPRVVSGFRPQWKEMVYSIVTDRSKGSRIWDIDRNEYIDLVNGFGPIMLGHRPDFVEKAIEAQLREGFETGPQTPLAGEVARMFCEMTGNERMAFCNTGSEAVLAAMRVSRTVTGRNKVVMFSGDYHGMFDEVLVKGFKNKAGEPQSAPIAPGIPRQSVSNMIVLDYGTEESLEWIRQNARDLAAVLVEPVQSRHPDTRPVEFLREVRKITEASETALIFDEVVTGFRVHQGGCQALFGIRADLATYGKVVAGGMPIGVLAGKSRFMDALDGGMWRYGDESYPEVGVTFFAGTFVRHPLAVAATKAVLQHFWEQGPALQERLNERTARLVRTLNEAVERHGLPTRIESFGSFFYFSFPAAERFASLFYFYMRDKGIHIREGFPCFLTTAHSDADIEAIARAFEESAVEMLEAGFFEQAGARDIALPAPTATKSGREEAREAPVTESQLEVWLSDQLSEEASCSYNESFSLHLRGNVNQSALKQALQSIVSRHQAFRATFGSEGELQNFATELRIDVPTVDLTSLTPSEREGRLQQIVRDDAHLAFQLSKGPLVRAQLVKMAAEHQVLIFTAHHIVCDGWSTNVLLDELSQAYNAISGGAAWSPSVPMPFAEYANSQAKFVDSPEGKKNEQYWLEQFRQPAPLLNLPVDRTRPAIKEFKGATHRTRIAAESYNRIKKFGASQKCTLFVTLLAGFQILLSRLSGQDDIVVGIPTAGQSLLDDAVLVGHCVNFIPLRGGLAGNPTAAEFLAQMKQTVLAGYEHQNYTYGRLVRKLALQRDPSRLPITEIQFNLERVGGALGFDGLEAEVDPNPKGFVNFDIFLNIMESKDGLTLDCDYNTGLFDEETIGRWLEHYKVLLEGMAARADRPVSVLPLLSASDVRQFESWNETRVERAGGLTVHGLFEAQAKDTPDAVAVVFGPSQFTYAELDRRTNQLAHHLRKLGVKPGVLVGVFIERSLEMLVALLGTLKAGGAYVPIDPTFPPERVRFVLEDAGASVVLTQTALTKEWSFGDARVVQLDGDWELIARADTKKPDAIAAPEDLAYVIYTSGSTGKPKGVEVPHRAVVNLLQSMLVQPGLARTDVLAAVTTLSFDISGLELFLPLCVGAKLAIVSRETAQYAVQLLEYLKEVSATVVQATPVTWQQLLEAGWRGEPALKVLCGGEAFPRELANELVKRAQSVWNMYGPTETTIWSAAVEVKAGDGPVPVGHPIANTQLFVLDRELQLAPIGVPGELYIAGLGLARGYHNRPELTAEKFVANPFAKEPGAKMYKTGDLVRRRSDGTLEFLGRLDNQIKLRGFRIELGEIESVLGNHPGVAQAVVLLREDVPGERRLVGYLVAAKGAVPTTADLRDFLVKNLPAYMAPVAYVTVEAMPLTPNGKIDRGALPVPNWSKQPEGLAYVAPRSPGEEAMAGIWAEVLRLERVGINDNLFELGADSLHVFQITARANKAGIQVTPRQVLQFRTIAAILEQLASSSQNQAQPPKQAIKPVPRHKYRLAPQPVRQVT